MWITAHRQCVNQIHIWQRKFPLCKSKSYPIWSYGIISGRICQVVSNIRFACCNGYFVWLWFRWERINSNMHVCRGCLSIRPFVRLFMRGCGCLWDVICCENYDAKIYLLVRMGARKRFQLNLYTRCPKRSEDYTYMRDAHLIRCFGCLLVLASENAFTCIPPNFAAG